MGARGLCVSAAAVLTAAVVVWGLVRSRERRLRCEAVSERLMAGVAVRDSVALRGQLEVFRSRLEREVAGLGSGSGPVVPVSPVVGVPSPRGEGADGRCPSVPQFPVSSSVEGGPR